MTGNKFVFVFGAMSRHILLGQMTQLKLCALSGQQQVSCLFVVDRAMKYLPNFVGNSVVRLESIFNVPKI